MSKKLKLQEGNKDQYGGVSELPDLPIKDPHTEKEKALERQILEINERITIQYKVIDKLVRDVKRIKDQISELAGRLPRG